MFPAIVFHPYEELCMNDLGKVNSSQLYNLWKNLTICLLAIIATVAISKILPYYLSPIVALAVGAFLYSYIYNTKVVKSGSCLVPCITILYCVVCYAFVTIILNLLHIWAFWDLPTEFVFFTDPFIPSLIMSPVGFIVTSIIYFRHDKLKICIECRMKRSMGGQRGAAGALKHESHLQLKNFVIVSGFITLVVWLYYFFFYVDVGINARDTYIFNWFTILVLLFDEFYFSVRYYNLYLDLKEGNELISASELNDMSAKSYLRYYVVCGDYMYMSEHAIDPSMPGHEVIDTPFFTKQSLNGIYALSDVKKIISEMTGRNDGELRFFYGRKSPNDQKHSLVRFFYFLDEAPDGELPKLEKEGNWMKFDKIKYLYSNKPQSLAEFAVYDITRLATIILTEKVFNEEGYRKLKIKSYNPGFDLYDVRKSKIDFQDDKWIEISLFNSDTPFYKFKKFFRERFGGKYRKWG